MKILHIISTLYTGGAEKLILDLVPLLIEKGHEVDVLLFNGTDTPFKIKLKESGVTIYSLGNNTRIYNPFITFKIIPFLHKYDVIHSHNTVCQYWLACAKFITTNKVKLVTTEHSTSNRRRAIPLFKYLDRFIYKQYNKIVSISDKTTENLIQYTGLSSDRVQTICNGINIQSFKDAVPLRIDFFQSKTIITMVAGFRQEKDQDTLIRAIALLPGNYLVCFVGDGVRRSVCEALVKSLHVEQQVLFMGVRSDVPQLLKASDVVVMSSHWEGFGLAAVEGMAAGKPVIASNVPGLAQVVKGAGILFDSGNERQLASEIKQVMEDKTHYKDTASRCIERAAQYDISKMVDGYDKMYNSL